MEQRIIESFGLENLKVLHRMTVLLKGTGWEGRYLEETGNAFSPFQNKWHILVPLCVPRVPASLEGGMSPAKGRDERVRGAASAALHGFKEMGSLVTFHNRGFPHITLELM